MTKPVDEYSWINIAGGVIGLEPVEIAEYEKSYQIMRQIASQTDYWDYFNWCFARCLDGNRASGFSALWHYEKAWKKLDELRRT